uniref:CFA20 domain-containing protein n=1 Tax=Arcella intermedia TaxID=1963864 RepID=A0A6B2LJY4_9EUKA|eukprot:TRINITY_DN25936_c0_g1_i1.p1 TRINITY_DN25936_c0_g1~~TRINITY_DN25936_c0_g1_i1.p1  ORF type:complete len:188 (-),score=29.31 TRINITY_DN25936_c0_g1_i1:64-627(-)
MFKVCFQTGFLSLFYSQGSDPLQLWDKRVIDGKIEFVDDEHIKSKVLEITGDNVAHHSIICPKDPKKTLGITLPYIILLVKNVDKFFSFEIQILDDKSVRRRFRASNFQSVTRVRPSICTLPLQLDDGWNQIQIDLAHYTKRAYGTNYLQTLQVQIHANCRIRRIYFAEKIMTDEELPSAFKLYRPG